MIRNLWRRYPDWVPTLGTRYRKPIAIVMALTPFIAGIDFLMGEHTESLTVVEQSMPAPLWGLLLVLAGTMTVGGYATRRPWICIWGLHLSGVLFACLAAGIAWASIDIEGGFRGPWAYLIIALFNWLAAVGYADQIRGGRS